MHTFTCSHLQQLILNLRTQPGYISWMIGDPVVQWRVVLRDKVHKFYEVPLLSDVLSSLWPRKAIPCLARNRIMSRIHRRLSWFFLFFVSDALKVLLSSSRQLRVNSMGGLSSTISIDSWTMCRTRLVSCKLSFLARHLLPIRALHSEGWWIQLSSCDKTDTVYGHSRATVIGHPSYSLSS